MRFAALFHDEGNTRTRGHETWNEDLKRGLETCIVMDDADDAGLQPKKLMPSVRAHCSALLYLPDFKHYNMYNFVYIDNS